MQSTNPTRFGRCMMRRLPTMPSETKCIIAIQTPNDFTPYWNQSFTEASESPSKQPPTTSFPSESAFPGADAAPEHKSWEVIQSSLRNMRAISTSGQLSRSVMLMFRLSRGVGGVCNNCKLNPFSVPFMLLWPGKDAAPQVLKLALVSMEEA